MLGAASAAGCSVTRQAPQPLTLHSLSSEELKEFAEPAPDGIKISPKKIEDGVEKRHGTLTFGEYELDFKTYRPTGHENENLPLVLILPILGGGEGVEDYFGGALSRAGFASACMERPGSTLRNHESIDELNRRFHAAVITQRAFITYLTSLGGVDESRAGCIGLSMGGMLGTVLSSVEPRIRWSALCLAGADMPDVFIHSNESRAIRWGGEKMAEQNLTVRQLQAQLRQNLRYEPAYYAQTLDPSRVLFVTADFDLTMPPLNSQLLWECLHRPQRLTVPAEHYTSFLFVWWITPQIVSFARERLGIPAPQQELE